MGHTLVNDGCPRRGYAMHVRSIVGSGALRAAATLAVAFTLAAEANAKTLYVNAASGNDATTYDQNGPTAPWRTIGRAAWGSTDRNAPNGTQAARAGDLVLVSSGTYAVAGTNSRNMPAYQPVNSGQAGNPITFKAEGLVNLTLSSGIGSVIGSFDRDFITWDGFTIHEASARSAPDTGAATIFLCDGCVFQNLDINGNGDDFLRMDNHTGIRVEHSSNILVRNNRVQNVHTGHNPNNGACIQTYTSGNMTFEHNELFDCGSGIFIKGNYTNNPLNGYITIRYNLIYDIGEIEPDDGSREGNAIALHVGAGNTAANPLRVYHNVIRNVYEAGVKIWMFNTDPTMNPMHAKIVNNTIENVRYGVWVTGDLLTGAGHVFWNNIVSGASDYGVAYGGSSSNLVESRFDAEHNLYYNYRVMAAVRSSDYSLATWRSTYNQDGSSPASINANPLFVSAQDLRLQAGSPARSLGVDFLDLDNDGSTSDIVPAGAYITGNEVIGRTNGPLPNPTLPTAPRNLRITTP